MLVASRRKAHRGFSRTIVRGGGLKWTRGHKHPDPDDQYNCSQGRIIPIAAGSVVIRQVPVSQIAMAART